MNMLKAFKIAYLWARNVKAFRGMWIFRAFCHFALFLGLFGAGPSFAQNPQTQSEFQALRIDGIEDTVLDHVTGSQEEVRFTYDPQALADAPPVETSIEKLQALSQEMRSENYQTNLAEKVVIPVSTEDAENLEALKSLKPEEVNTFIAKKSYFLQKVAGLFQTLRVKASAVNKMLNLMNKQFFKNAGVIAKANARVISIQLGVSAGVGFSDWLMTQLRKSPYLADLPSHTGFYFMLSTGISIVRTQKDGKTKISIEPIVDFRRSTRIFTPFVSGSAGLITTYTLENRAEVTTLQKANFYKISSLTTISGLQQAGVSGSFVVAVPPMGGIASGIEGEIYRLRLTPKALSQMVESVRGFISKTIGKKCESVFP
ncbi:hypothetical protein [Bdellovibrio sp. HCB337]|uniref:hypothetical protein n=1 Tax=Bdellovibrio sp. HCB337 TaxID=3394358 RepID=UPI0039A63916